MWDLAFVVFSWVPLHARHVAAADGFTDVGGRPRRLRRLLDAYGYEGSAGDVLDVVHARVAAHAQGIRRQAAAGDPPSVRLVDAGVADDLDQALLELDRDPALRPPGY